MTQRDPRPADWTMRAFRALLFLYPGEFRDEYGRELALVFADRYRDATGTLQRIALWFEAIFGLLREAPKEHLQLLVHDLTLAIRSIRHSPGFAATVIATLALGIGANAAIFQLINAVQFTTLPVSNPRQLVEVRIPDGNGGFGVNPSRYGQLTRPIWDEIRANQQPFSGVFAWGSRSLGVGEISDLRFANGIEVSGEFFTVLGVRPFQGRLLEEADAQTACPASQAVVSYSYWQREMGGRSLGANTRLKIGGNVYDIVGVTPPEFFGLAVGETFDIALPLCRPQIVARQVFDISVVGRLRDGWSIGQASAHFDVLSKSIFEATVPAGYSADSTNRYKSFRLGAFSVATGVSGMRQRYDTSLRLLLAITGLILLIACANLANLLLARAIARQREVSIRLALGGSRSRLVRQFLTESAMLALLGAVAGVFIAQILSRTLVWILASLDRGPGSTPLTLEIALDWRLIAFAAVVVAGTCLIVGVLPALRATRIDPASAINAGGRAITMGRTRFAAERLMVITQLAVSIVLLAGGLLFVQSFRNLMIFDPGVRLKGITITRLAYDQLGVPAERLLDFQRELRDEIAAIPGVAGAGTTSNVPLLGSSWGHSVQVGEVKDGARFTWASPGYFETMGIRLIEGRDFTRQDTQNSARVAVVNEAFARRFGNGRSMLGQTLRTGAEPGYPSTVYEIVGMIPDTQYSSLRGGRPPIVFAPDTQHPAPRPGGAIMVFSTLDPAAIGSTVKKTLKARHPGLFVDSLDFEATVRGGLVRERILAILAAFFGALAAILAMVGVYGMVSFMVAHRQKEIGIRLAMGARGRQVVMLVMRQVGWMLLASVPIGVGVALLAGRSARTMLFGVQPHDLMTFVVACSLLAIVAVAASFIPARVASRVDPLRSLRSE